MNLDPVSKKNPSDQILTVQVHHQNLDPRTFKVPIKWIYRSSVLAWLLIVISLTAIFFAVKTYRMKGGSQAGLIETLEQEIRDLKKTNDTLASSASVSSPPATTSGAADPNARDSKPEAGIGQTLAATDGVWTGLAPHITLPPAGTTPTVKLSDVKISWQNKYAIVTGIVAYAEPGKGSQQGHIVVLARGKDRIFSHPDGVLNVPTSSYLFDPNRGEYFSVARFRILKTKFGPYESPSQLGQIQVYLFDLGHKLILTQAFQNGK